MMANFSGKINSFLGLKYDESVLIWLSNGIYLRRLIGILGMALPILLPLVLYFLKGRTAPLPSISHYYYTSAGNFFVITLSVMAIFLIIYQGRSLSDFYISTLAGLFALCVVFFPTNNMVGADLQGYCIVEMKDADWRSHFHLASAGIFLLCLAAMSIFLFPRPDQQAYRRPERKQLRNRIYIGCGVVMIAALATALLGFVLQFSTEANCITYWMETIAVEAFGISWLVKGNTLFGEPHEEVAAVQSK